MNSYRSYILFFLITLFTKAGAQKNLREYYQLSIYHYTSNTQEALLNNYLENALLPGLHKLGITRIGAFKNLSNDTAETKKMYVLIPFHGLEQWTEIDKKLTKNEHYRRPANNYINAPAKAPAYNRIETILLKAFSNAPVLQKPGLTNNKSDRVYELRSYESGTEKLFRNKVDMFNEGDEIGLFKRLGFNAVFYGEVLAGGRMPNLMYMTAHADMPTRNLNWKNFGADTTWKRLSSDSKYQDNVSHIEINFLKAMPYSDL